VIILLIWDKGQCVKFLYKKIDKNILLLISLYFSQCEKYKEIENTILLLISLYFSQCEKSKKIDKKNINNDHYLYLKCLSSQCSKKTIFLLIGKRIRKLQVYILRQTQ
jgi:hypothetical protein